MSGAHVFSFCYLMHGPFRRLLFYAPDYRKLPRSLFQGLNKRTIAVLEHVLLNPQDRNN